MKILALDVGQKRIGVATCDRLEIAASPFCVVKAGKTAVEEVTKIIDREGAEAVVIGLPVSFDGVERESCERARFFKNELEKRTALPISFLPASTSISRISIYYYPFRFDVRLQYIVL